MDDINKGVEFRSNIPKAVMSRLLRLFNMIIILFIIDQIFNFSDFIISIVSIKNLVFIYGMLFILQLVISNSDLLISKNSLEIKLSILGKFSWKRIQKKTISEIIFKDDWTESYTSKYGKSIVIYTLIQICTSILPWDYKWIEIRFKNGESRKYYFYGMDYDFYDNSDDVLFEDMFLELARRNVKVRWKSINDGYFRDLQARADLYRSTNGEYFKLNNDTD